MAPGSTLSYNCSSYQASEGMSSHLINSLCHYTIRNHFTQMSHSLLAAGPGHSWISLCELWKPLCAAISTALGALVCIYLSRQPAFTEQSALLTSRYLGPWPSQSGWRAEGVCWGTTQGRSGRLPQGQLLLNYLPREEISNVYSFS